MCISDSTSSTLYTSNDDFSSDDTDDDSDIDSDHEDDDWDAGKVTDKVFQSPKNCQYRGYVTVILKCYVIHLHT